MSIYEYVHINVSIWMYYKYVNINMSPWICQSDYVWIWQYENPRICNETSNEYEPTSTTKNLGEMKSSYDSHSSDSWMTPWFPLENAWRPHECTVKTLKVVKRISNGLWLNAQILNQTLTRWPRFLNLNTTWSPMWQIRNPQRRSRLLDLQHLPLDWCIRIWTRRNNSRSKWYKTFFLTFEHSIPNIYSKSRERSTLTTRIPTCESFRVLGC